MPAVLEALSRRLLYEFPDDSSVMAERYCCRLCDFSCPGLTDLKQHVVSKTVDVDRGFVEHRKKVLALAEHAGPVEPCCRQLIFLLRALVQMVFQICLRCKFAGAQVPGMSRQRAVAANFDERLRCPPGMDSGRAEGGCVVCARRFWANELYPLVLLQPPDEHMPSIEVPAGAETVAQSAAQALPLVRASAVEHPYMEGELLLLHRRRVTGLP